MTQETKQKLWTLLPHTIYKIKMKFRDLLIFNKSLIEIFKNVTLILCTIHMSTAQFDKMITENLQQSIVTKTLKCSKKLITSFIVEHLKFFTKV